MYLFHSCTLLLEAQGQYLISFIFLGVYYFSLGLQELLLNLTHAHTTPLSCSKNCFSTGFQCLSLTAGVPCLPEIQPNPRVCKQARAKQAQDFGRDGMWSLSWYVESYCAAHAQLQHSCVSVFLNFFGAFKRFFFFPCHFSDIMHSPLIPLFVFFPQIDISNQLSYLLCCSSSLALAV